MTPEDRVRVGGVVLVLDAANVSMKKLLPLAKAARAGGCDLRFVVPVTAHVEKLMDLRQVPHLRYDAEVVRRALEDAQVEILWLDAAAAETVAERLWTWFPSKGEWHDAKLRRLHGDAPRSANRRAPATIDWYTAALCPPGAIVVTNDTGAEFHRCDVIKSDALERVLRELAPG